MSQRGRFWHSTPLPPDARSGKTVPVRALPHRGVDLQPLRRGKPLLHPGAALKAARQCAQREAAACVTSMVCAVADAARQSRYRARAEK